MNTLDATAASTRSTSGKPFLVLLAGTLGFALFTFVTSALLASSWRGTSAIAYQIATMAVIYGGCLYAGSCVGRFGRHSTTADTATALAAVTAALVAGVAAGVVTGSPPQIGALDPMLPMDDVMRLGGTTVASGLIALLVGALLAARETSARPGRKNFKTFMYFEDFDTTIDLREAIDLREEAEVDSPSAAASSTR